MKKILVLGAGGFLGKSIIKKIHTKYNVVAFDMRHTDFFGQLTNVNEVVGDFKNRDLLLEILDNVDIVIHLISTTIPSDSTDSIDKEIFDNVIPTVTLLNCMAEKGVKEIIFSSSGGTIYGDTGEKINKENSIINPSCSYGIQKATIESYIKYFNYRYGIKYKIMRISNPYGVGQDANKMQGLIPILMNKLINDEPVSIYGDGSNMRDYIYLDDLIDCFCSIIEYDGNDGTFNIGYGEYWSINEVMRLVEKEVGKKFTEVNYLPRRLCDVNKSFLDFSHSKKELNWEPKVSIKEGIKKLYSLITR